MLVTAIKRVLRPVKRTLNTLRTPRPKAFASLPRPGSVQVHLGDGQTTVVQEDNGDLAIVIRGVKVYDFMAVMDSVALLQAVMTADAPHRALIQQWNNTNPKGYTELCARARGDTATSQLELGRYGNEWDGYEHDQSGASRYSAAGNDYQGNMFIRAGGSPANMLQSLGSDEHVFIWEGDQRERMRLTPDGLSVNGHVNVGGISLTAQRDASGFLRLMAVFPDGNVQVIAGDVVA